MSFAEQLVAPVTRKTTVTLNLDEKGNVVPVKVDVYYKSRTTKIIRDNPEMTLYADLLGTRLTKLVDTRDNSALEVTQDLLDAMDVKNLRIIFEALEGDVDPK